MTNEDRIVMYRGPAWAWDTIWETISMDVSSGRIDEELRGEIATAQMKIEEVDDDDETNIPGDADRDPAGSDEPVQEPRDDVYPAGFEFDW